MSYSGKFRPSNYLKYKGDPSNIVYRSLWELKFMNYCDKNENILEWGSEELWIPYVSPKDNRVHRYFPDFYIKYRNRQGNIQKSLIEIKPLKQTKKPNMSPKRKTKTWMNEVVTYGVNQAKWRAAEEFCEDRLWDFKILTEKELGI
tara:strand:- start:2965 stop:3402 length:438 start_codon:yes stop_codon:yes gene_type:complete